MKSLISFIALIGLATCATFGSYDSKIDPGRITWPEETWHNNPIEVSQANAEASVKLTFNFKTSTSINLDTAVVQFIYPSTWSTVTTNPETITVKKLPAGEYSFSTKQSLTLPATTTATVLGPFGIVTRTSETGQIIDANYVFGCIAYSKSESSVTSAGSLTVDSTGKTALKASDTLYFTFSISQSLWKHDIIEIVPATDWVPQSSPSCTSENEEGTTVLSGYDSNKLRCGLSSSSSPLSIATSTTPSVYIYGLEQDLYYNGTASKIKLSVSSFTLPSYVLTSSSNTWYLKIWRWGTTSLIAKYSATTGPVDTVAGSITVSSWKPYSSIGSSNVVKGMTLFTVASITTTNALNGGGNIKITYSGVKINDALWWTDLYGSESDSSKTLCYLSPYIAGSTCAVDSSTQVVTLTFTSTQAAGTFKVHTLTVFKDATAYISTITSTNGNSKTVDKSSANPSTWTLTTSLNMMTDCAFHGYSAASATDGWKYPEDATYDSSDTNKIQGGKYKEFLYFRVKPYSSATWAGSATETLTFNLPLVTNEISLNSVFIGTSATSYQAINRLGSEYSLSGSTLSTISATVNTNSISVAIAKGQETLTTSNYYILGYYGSDDGTGGTKALTSLPYVASNVATFYEMWAQANTAKEIGSSVFSVLPQTGDDLYTTLLCTSAGSGIPIVTYFKAVNMEFNFASTSYNYAIDILIQGDSDSYDDTTGFMGTYIMAGTLGSGYFATSSSTPPTVKIATNPDDSNQALVTISKYGTVSSGTPVTTYLPNVNTKDNKYTAKTTFYYTQVSDDTATPFVLYQNSGTYSAWTKITDTVSWGAYKITSADDDDIDTPVLSGDDSTTWTIGNSRYIQAILSTTGEGDPASSASDVSDANIIEDYIIGVGLSTGWTTTSSSTLNMDNPGDASEYTTETISSTSGLTYAVSSASDTAQGGFMLGKVTSDWGIVTETVDVGGTEETPTYKFSATAFTLRAGSITPPNWLGSSASYTSSSFTWFVATNDLNIACLTASAEDSGTVTIKAGSISLSSYTPTTLAAAGPDSLDTSISVTFSVTHAIPTNGYIVITLSTDWQWSSSNFKICSSSSITASGSSDTCSISTNVITLSNFNKIAAGSSITVQISHVIPPSSADTYQLVSKIESFATSATSGYIDTYANSETGDSPVTVTEATLTGTSSGMAIAAYPNVAGQVADLSINYTLPYALPLDGTLTIKAPSDASFLYSSSVTNIQDYCWVDAGTDIYYANCKFSSSNVVLDFNSDLASGKVIKIYLDAAITVPTSFSTGFITTAAWSGKTIYEDASTGVTFTPGTAITPVVTISSISIWDDQNQGELATYIFSFTSGVAVSAGDYFVIRFPRDFDPYLGDATATYQSTPNNWYLLCSSTSFGTTTCMVDHWQLYVYPKNTPVANAALDLTVTKIRNPYTASSGSGKFSVYHYNKSGTLLASVYQSQTVTTSSPASQLTLKRVASSSIELSASSSYDFDFYVTSDLAISSVHVISIIFPQEFNLKLTSGSSTACTSSYYDESNDSGTTSTTAISWNSQSTCTIDGQNVTLSIPSSISALTFESADRIRVSFSSLTNPQYGITDRKDATGWDATDTDEFGDIYSWSNKFNVIIHNTYTRAVFARSYGVLHSGYIGYTLSTSKPGSDSNPVSSPDRIILLPGEQSEDLTISVSNSWPLMSKNLTFKATPNANYGGSDSLKITSTFHNFIVYQMDQEFTFRIAASSSTSNGIYYIDWTVTEGLQEGVESARYSAPVSTLVEVNSGYTTTPTITLGTIYSLYPGYTSLPIPVTLSNAPASDLTITLALDSASNIASLSSTTLKFTPGVNVKYFTITIGSAYTSTTTVPTLSFSLSGTDSAIYTAPGSQKLTVTTKSTPTTTAATVKLSKSTVSASSATITFTPTQNSVLYWGIGCSGHTAPTFSELVAMVSDLVSPSSTIPTLDEQLSTEYGETETDINASQNDTDIYSFFRRKQQEHCNNYWASSQVIPASTTISKTFNWLHGGNTYTLVAYVDNKLINNTSSFVASTLDFSTTDLPKVQTTTVTFAGTVSATADSVKKILAKNMGVNPSWLVQKTSSRRLEDSTTPFTFYVLYDRSKSSYTPSAIISNLDKDASDSELTTLAGVSPSYTTAEVSTTSAPSFVGEPSNLAKTQTTAKFSAASSLLGYICTVCSESASAPSASQVLVGLDSTSTSVPSACMNVVTASTSLNITVSELTAGTTYNCYFAVCNDYPLWPTCSDTVKAASVTTLDSDDDSAVYMGAGLLTALFLIFN